MKAAWRVQINPFQYVSNLVNLVNWPPDKDGQVSSENTTIRKWDLKTRL